MAQKKMTGAGAATGAAVGLAVIAALAGAQWFYASKDAEKHRKAARSWMQKAQNQVLTQVKTAVKKAGDIDKDTYLKIVNGVVKSYSGAAGVSAEELAQLTKGLTNAWQQIQKKGSKTRARVAKRAKVAKKTVTKKVAKKRGR